METNLMAVNADCSISQLSLFFLPLSAWIEQLGFTGMMYKQTFTPFPEIVYFIILNWPIQVISEALVQNSSIKLTQNIKII